MLRSKWMPGGPEIAGYQLFGVFAEGGMATVHVGVRRGDAGFRRAVAIKRLREEHASDRAHLDMLVDEARLAGRMNHPNVVPVIDVVREEDRLALIMPLVRGVSLARLLEGAGTEPCPPDVAVAIALDVLAGLEAAHALSVEGQSLGVIHRDVSPSNVLVGADGIAQLLDFGIAKAAGRLHVTRAQERKGKLAFMAPEQLEGRGDHRVDVYALSALLWMLLVGRPLFGATTANELVSQVLSAPVQRPSRARPDVPRSLDAVVMRGLERDPDYRWPTAREMKIALEKARTAASREAVGAWVTSLASADLARIDVLVDEAERAAPSVAISAPKATPRRHSRHAAGLLVALLGASGLAMALGSRGSPPAPATAASASSSFPVPSVASVASADPETRSSVTPLPVSAPAHRPAVTKPSVVSHGAAKHAAPECSVRVWADENGTKHYDRSACK